MPLPKRAHLAACGGGQNKVHWNFNFIMSALSVTAECVHAKLYQKKQKLPQPTYYLGIRLSCTQTHTKFCSIQHTFL